MIFYLGDGILAGIEQCDTIGVPALPNDGCGANCMIENGWNCSYNASIPGIENNKKNKEKEKSNGAKVEKQQGREANICFLVFSSLLFLFF